MFTQGRGEYVQGVGGMCGRLAEYVRRGAPCVQGFGSMCGVCAVEYVRWDLVGEQIVGERIVGERSVYYYLYKQKAKRCVYMRYRYVINI